MNQDAQIHPTEETIEPQTESVVSNDEMRETLQKIYSKIIK